MYVHSLQTQLRGLAFTVHCVTVTYISRFIINPLFSALISQMVDNRDAVMFGVPVPGTEGKAGMAVIQDDGTLCLQEFLKKAQGVIPAYALPLFVRLVKEVEQTSTNKMMKSTYIRDGYDLTKVKQDPLYFLDMSKKQYVRVNDELLHEITTGKRRL